MMCRSVTIRSVGIGPTPSENRSTIYDEIICSNHTTTKSRKHTHKKQAFKQWCTGCVTTLPLL